MRPAVGALPDQKSPTIDSSVTSSDSGGGSELMKEKDKKLSTYMMSQQPTCNKDFPLTTGSERLEMDWSQPHFAAENNCHFYT